MTPLLRAFDDAMRSLGVLEQRTLVEQGDPCFVVPAKNHSVGDLTIIHENDELTVCVGELFHTHYTPSFYHGPQERRLAEAAMEAAGYVAEVLRDRVRFTVKFRGQNCVGVTSEYVDPADGPPTHIGYPLNAWFFRAVRIERYVWSGRVP